MRMTRIILTLCLLLLVLSACTSFHRGDQVYLDQKHWVNPYDFGPHYWMMQQNNNCYLYKGLAIIIDINHNGEYALLKQEQCTGWAPSTWLKNPPK